MNIQEKSGYIEISETFEEGGFVIRITESNDSERDLIELFEIPRFGGEPDSKGVYESLTYALKIGRTFI